MDAWRPNLWPHPSRVGPREGFEGLSVDHRGGGRHPIAASGSPRLSVEGRSPAEKRSVGSSRGPFEVIAGVESPRKGPLRGHRGSSFLVQDDRGPSREEFLACTTAFLSEKALPRGLQMIPRSLDFSVCSGSAIRGSPLPGLKGLGRVPAGPAIRPLGSPFLRLSASIDRGWRLEGPDHDRRRGDPGGWTPSRPGLATGPTSFTPRTR